MGSLERLFVINQKVTLEVLEGADQGRYSTQVEEFREDALVLAAPGTGRNLLLLAPGTPVRVQTDHQPSGVRTMETKVRESLPVRPNRRAAVIVLEPPAQVEQVQRRADVRIDIVLPVRFSILTSPEEEGQAPTAWPSLEGETADLSAGGSQIATAVRLVAGTQLDVSLRLPDKEERLQLVGEVVRLLRSEERKGSPVYFLAVRWVGVETRDRDAIVGFIFREQLRRRRRGLL